MSMYSIRSMKTKNANFIKRYTRLVLVSMIALFLNSNNSNPIRLHLDGLYTLVLFPVFACDIKRQNMF